MSFTAAYFLRLAAWGLILATLLGSPVWMSWRRWDRVLSGASANVRYRLVCGHFLALLILPGTVVGSVHLTLAAMGAEISREPSPLRTLAALDGRGAGRLAVVVVAVWLTGALLATVRLAMDAWQLRRLRRGPAPACLVDEVCSLALRFPGNSRLAMWAADVPVPQVAGVRRPILIVPADFVRLPAAEREAILLHELAHVARRDFLANLLQRVALAALWFQPVAYRLYRHTSHEREACCDQLAVGQGASAPALARALVRLAGSRVSPPVAMAVAGRGDLGWRIHRLMTLKRVVLPSRLWQGALLGAFALVSSGLGGARLAVADRAMTDFYIASALGPVVSVSAHDPGGAFGLRIRRGNVLEATVEDRPLPPTSIRQHGDRVMLLGATKEPVVSFRVTPFGRIEWQARLARAPGS